MPGKTSVNPDVYDAVGEIRERQVEDAFSESIYGPDQGRRNNRGGSVACLGDTDREKLHYGSDAAMTPCPKCGNQHYKESRQCPEHSGLPVCIRCCRECAYYDPDPCGLKCRWYINHQETDYQSEIEKINQKINHMEGKVRRLYELN